MMYSTSQFWLKVFVSFSVNIINLTIQRVSATDIDAFEIQGLNTIL